MDSEARTVRVGSRKSELALKQTNMVIELLKKTFTDVKFEIIKMSTTGDKILDKALSKIGEKALFTKELEVALEKKEVDFVVHSLKDLPTTLPEGMVIGAICRREDPSDALIMHRKYEHLTLDSLPANSVIGTSSLRRIAQLKRKYPNLQYESIRGNLNTRFRKLDDDDTYAALILAYAGVSRLGLGNRISQKLPPDICMYAVGQGALAVEVRADDVETRRLISVISDKDTALCCLAERAFLKALEGGCSVPVAVHSFINDGNIELTGGVFSLDGSQSIIDTHRSDLNYFNNKSENTTSSCHHEVCGVLIDVIQMNEHRAAERCGLELAVQLQKKGATEILNNVRQQSMNKLQMHL